MLKYSNVQVYLMDSEERELDEALDDQEEGGEAESNPKQVDQS